MTDRDVIKWLVTANTGTSSIAMVAIAYDLKPSEWGYSTPSDPSDFNRCLMLVHSVPSIKKHFAKIRLKTKYWESVIDNWDLIEKTFIDECGFNWSKAGSAPITYKLMKDLQAKVRAEND